MRKVAQKSVARPNATDDSTNARIAAAARNIVSLGAGVADGDRSEREAARARELADYAALEKGKEGHVEDMSIGALFAYATGTCEFDPIAAMLQEFPIQLRMLRLALDSAEEEMSEKDVSMALFLLERRAQVVEELYGRVVHPVLHTVKRSALADSAADSDAAAEE